MTEDQEDALRQIAKKLGISLERLQANKRLYESACAALDIREEIPTPPIIWIYELQQRAPNEQNKRLILGSIMVALAIIGIVLCFMLGVSIGKHRK
jgi:hypothetical protein